MSICTCHVTTPEWPLLSSRDEKGLVSILRDSSSSETLSLLKGLQQQRFHFHCNFVYAVYQLSMTTERENIIRIRPSRFQTGHFISMMEKLYWIMLGLNTVFLHIFHRRDVTSSKLTRKIPNRISQKIIYLKHYVVLVGIFGFKPASQFIGRRHSVVICALYKTDIISKSFC